jgi:pyruvate/2-oxoglutarate dehydrogenase complex dihydrolipoamide acyltransferase (E2) component
MGAGQYYFPVLVRLDVKREIPMATALRMPQLCESVADNDAIAVRPMAYQSLTFDHRVMDGAVADRFMQALKQTLESWS